MSDEDFALALSNKLMGQVNLVRVGKSYMTKGGSIILTSGVLSREPIPGSVAISMVNGAWEAKLSHIVHVLLYVTMVALPVTGYLMSSTYKYGHGIDFFGLTLPAVLPKNDYLFGIFQWLHANLGILLLVLVALHIAGALKHRFFENKENDVLKRIL